MPTTIESLELEVQSSATSATGGIDALSASLSKLKNAVKGGVGLTSVANQLNNLNAALKGVDASSADKIDKLANSLSKLSGLGQIKISSSIGNQLKSISSAATSLNGVDLTGIGKLSTALQPLSNLGKSNLSSFITQLSKLPQLAQTLNGMNMAQFTSQIQQLSNALAPLASQLNTVSAAFNQLPTNIRRTVSATNALPASNNKAATSYVNLWAKARMAMNVVKNGARIIASWITESNSYIEDLNLFTASMGEYANEAQKYAEQVGEIMGIDPGEWMRNQGIFMTITKGFGVASDRAYTMSQNLTQLGYDLSSFFNISYEDAMQKLSSGISGELEPLRRLGYDLSQARLQQEAYNLGIQESVQNMTQAEKSQLRYYAIMTQVTTAQGDMARTLNAPANQLRVLQAQVTQCARALGNIFIPALNAVLPYAIALAKVLRLIANTIANFFGFELPEVDYSSISAGSSAVDDLTDSENDATKAAKKLKNAMTGIDELNIISPNDSTSGSGAGTGDGSDLGFDLPTYDFMGELVNSKVDEIVQMIKDAMNEITAVISGFLLAIGTILVVTGANIPLGLGLMAIGAVGLAATIAANWDTMSERLAKTLTIITAVLGGFLLAIGAFLLFSGVNVPLGAGLMVAGAVALGTAVAINWHALDGDLKNALSILTAIVGGALLAMGALFAFTGVDIPLGIALMVAGAAGIVAAIGLNWDCLSPSMKKVIATIEAIVGGGLLALGAILAFTGANIPLGIAMIAAGAISIVSAVALSWDSLSGDLKSQISAITAIVSGALIGIGAVLAFTGVATPLGIAMIAAGAVGLVSTVALNWDSINNKIKEVLKAVGITVGAALIALGAILAFSGAALPLGIALIAAGAVSLASGVALNWDSLPKDVQSVVTKILVICGAAALAIGAILAFTGVALPLGIGLMLAGAAALGTAVALNWDTFVEKIKGVVTKILLIAGAAALAIGIILVCTGVGIPLGIGLILAGAASLGTAAAMNWDSIKEKVGACLEGVASKFGEFKKSVSEKLDKAKESIQTWAGNVKEYFTKGADGKNAIDNIKEAAGEWGESFKKGLSNKFKKANSWVKKNITTPLKNAIEKSPVGEFAVELKNNASDLWGKAKEWWADATKDGISVEAAVSLAKKGWSTVKGWIGNIPTLSQMINLMKSGWESVKSWIGNIPIVSQAIDLIKSGWETVKGWIGNIPTISQAINLIKSGWQSVKDWIGTLPIISQAISLLKSGWTTVKNWVGSIPTLDQAISLIKSGWTTVKNWIGTIPVVSQAISLLKSGWSTVKGWIGSIPAIDQAIKLIKSGWSSISSFVGTSVSVGISLFKSGWTSISSWIGSKVSVGISLFKSGWSSIKSFFGLANGGIVGANGGVKAFATGGSIGANGMTSFWDSIPKYANGTANAHGTMFVAGEAGAEVVGHVNGNTEVLNRSQLAAIMQNSVVAGMGQFTGFWRALDSQMAICANAIIRSVLVSADLVSTSFATQTSYDPTNTLAQTMYEDSQRANNNSYSDDGISASMIEFYRDYVEPTLKSIATDTKRQADKEEQTIVQVGNRTITDAVTTQQKANGYKFAT